MGKYPFSWNSRWDIGILGLCLVSYFILFIALLELLPSSHLHLRRLFSSFFVSVITVIILSKSYSSSESVYSDISYCVNSHDLQSPSVLANRNSLPSLKYLLLQGPSSIQLNNFSSVRWFNSDQEPQDSRSENILAHVNDLNLSKYDIILSSFFDSTSATNIRLISDIKKSHIICSSSSPNTSVYINKSLQLGSSPSLESIQ